MVKNNFYLLFIISFFLVSCENKTFENAEELTAFINDSENEYKYEKVVNNVSYELVYRPTDLMVKQELGGEKNEKKVQDLRARYSKFMYFNLSMSLKGQELLSSVAKNKAKFGGVVNELAFGMDERVHLFTPKKDTLTMVDFVYPRMYGMTNSTSIMIVYPRDKKYFDNEYLNFTVEDIGFSTGEVKFKIKTKSILNEPQLQF